MNFILYLSILLIILIFSDHKSVKSVAISISIIVFCITMYIDYINYIDNMLLDGDILVSILILINILGAFIKMILFVIQSNKVRSGKQDK